MAGVSGSFRRNIRRKLRNLKSLGTVSFESASKKTDLARAFAEFVRTEASSWKGTARTALLYDHARRHFYEELTAKLAATNKCIIDTLRLDGEPIAAQYGVVTGNTYYLLKIGYNPKYKGQSPGALLLDHTLQVYSGHPMIRKISFVTGAKWNDDWAPQKLSVFNHYVYPETMKGALGLILHRVKHLASR
jgi:CelD/BcsL family acetyltransferase involved in cellulose biosynthesis